MVTTDFGSGLFDAAATVIPLADGRIVVAGIANGQPADFGLARYHSNGSLDSTFGSNGMVVTDFNGDEDMGYWATLQPDGKIVVAGNVYNGNDYDFAVARYHPDGVLDSSFSLDGKTVTSIGIHDFAYSVASHADGSIVVAGETDSTGAYRFALARYTSDGNLDSSFDGDGKLITAFGPQGNGVASVILLPDRKVVVAGYTQNTPSMDFAIVRYNPDGSFDSTFGGDGIVTTDFAGGDDGAYSLTLAADGKFVVSGYADNGSDWDFGVARYWMGCAGLLDTTVTQSGSTLTAGATAATYQWLDCNSGFTPIAGATNQSFTPVTSGSYALAVTQYGCTDTSGCRAVTIVGVSDAAHNIVRFFPNPTSGMLAIQIEGVLEELEVEVIDARGRLVSCSPAISSYGTIEIEGPAGLYWVSLRRSETILARVKVVKQ
jgi:uncharacterized delta-60 repeat protein